MLNPIEKFKVAIGITDLWACHHIGKGCPGCQLSGLPKYLRVLWRLVVLFWGVGFWSVCTSTSVYIICKELYLRYHILWPILIFRSLSKTLSDDPLQTIKIAGSLDVDDLKYDSAKTEEEKTVFKKGTLLLQSTITNGGSRINIT